MFFKRYILYFANGLLFWLSRIFVDKSKAATGPLVLIPPTDEGSFGDEAMIISVLSGIERSEYTDVIVLNGESKSWQDKIDAYGVDAKCFPVWKNFQRPNTIFRYIKFINKFKPKSVYLIGADVMDGYYSESRSLMRTYLLRIAACACSDVRLLGFSFNATPNMKCVASLKSLSKNALIFARDPVSASRLMAYGVKCESLADLAFMLEPVVIRNSAEIDRCSKFIGSQKSIGKRVICVNINAIHNAYPNFFENLIELFNYLIRNDFSLIFISHDDRDFNGFSDFSLAEAAISRIGSENSFLIKEDMDAAELKYIANKTEMVITGRMHFAIGALSTCIPALMFGYQGKQEGLAQLIGVESKDIVISPNSNSDEMIESFVNFNDKVENISLLIKNNIQSIKLLSKKNLL